MATRATIATMKGYAPRVYSSIEQLRMPQTAYIATPTGGVMPPKGGATNLSDDDVKAAVDYMVAAAK